jgi:hypothetical protein
VVVSPIGKFQVDQQGLGPGAPLAQEPILVEPGEGANLFAPPPPLLVEVVE